MSIGVSLSQLISQTPDPLSSGIPELDHVLNNGFQTRSIYEVYGPPGVGKTRFGLQLLQNTSSTQKCLWVETFKPIPILAQQPHAPHANINKIRIAHFTELFYFMNKLKKIYSLIVIDGMSQLVCDHLYILHKRSKTAPQNLHNTKCKHLIQLFTAMTKYANGANCTIVLLNDCMNTSFTNDYNNIDEEFDVLSDKNNFYVISASRRRNVQTLKSALLASSVAMGKKDSRWEIFIRKKIGMFWGWQPEISPFSTNGNNMSSLPAVGSSRPKRKNCRVIIIEDTKKRPRTGQDSLEQAQTSRSITNCPMRHICVDFDTSGHLRPIAEISTSISQIATPANEANDRRKVPTNAVAICTDEVKELSNAEDELVGDSQSSVI